VDAARVVYRPSRCRYAPKTGHVSHPNCCDNVLPHTRRSRFPWSILGYSYAHSRLSAMVSPSIESRPGTMERQCKLWTKTWKNSALRGINRRRNVKFQSEEKSRLRAISDGTFDGCPCEGKVEIPPPPADEGAKTEK
jgi:hypothetical protein